MTSAPVHEGQIIADKYRVDRILGAGGMGVVVAATHLQLEEPVAIKLLLPEVIAVPGVVERFSREARASIKIKSEHIVRVMDVGELETGEPYMVMEMLHGSDLSDILETRGPLPVAEAVDYLVQACRAVAEAHTLGIVHRDLKPANLFVTQRTDGSPLVKVLDFGISKVGPTGPGAGLTQTSAVMGSPLYMSPEQMRSSRDVDMRADIWSLGAILYELLVGHPPFEADNFPQMVALVIQTEPKPVRETRPEVPEPLDQAVLKALSKNVAARWQTVAELTSAIAPYGLKSTAQLADAIERTMEAAGLATGRRSTTVPQTAAAPPAASTSTNWEGNGGATTRSGRPSRVAAVVAGVGVVAALGVGAALLLRRPTSPSAPGVSTTWSSATTSTSQEALAPLAASVAQSAETGTLVLAAPSAAAIPHASVAARLAPSAAAPLEHSPGKNPAKKDTPSVKSAQPKDHGLDAFKDNH